MREKLAPLASFHFFFFFFLLCGAVVVIDGASLLLPGCRLVWRRLVAAEEEIS